MTGILQSLFIVRSFILTSNPSANELTSTRLFCVPKQADYEIWNTNSGAAELRGDMNYLCAQVLITVPEQCEATKYQT